VQVHRGGVAAGQDNGLALRQPAPCREPLGQAEGMAHRRYTLRENRPVLPWRPLPCRHSRLAQASTGPRVR
jgi:hypothetical protein